MKLKKKSFEKSKTIVNVKAEQSINILNDEKGTKMLHAMKQQKVTFCLLFRRLGSYLVFASQNVTRLYVIRATLFRFVCSAKSKV